MNAQLKLKEAYEKLSESERVRFLFVCYIHMLFLFRAGDSLGLKMWGLTWIGSTWCGREIREVHIFFVEEKGISCASAQLACVFL